jgi:ABC-type polysaccharide/polyol phosphate transport system ATPase subunit
MNERTLLEVSGLSKIYCTDLRRSLRYGVSDILRDTVGRRRSKPARRPGEFQALDDVSFSLERGRALAILGHNGAGKSTLLKILNGLIKPDGGSVRIAGSVGALIELGTGLNPHLSGRENILLGAAINRWPRSREQALIEEVTEFSGLAPAIDQALHTYSSGMKARLAFSLVAMMRHDLLLVDEVLAVGDHEFQRKCVAFMLEHLREGRSLLFVSHNGHQVQAVCQEAILLDHGRLAFAGEAGEALQKMYDNEKAAAVAPGPSYSDGPVAIEGLFARPTGPSGVMTGEPVDLVLRYRAAEALDVNWAVTIWSADGWVCVTSAMDTRARRILGEGELVCRVPALPLVAGRYLLSASIVDPATLHPFARIGGGGGGMVAMEVGGPPGLVTNLQRQLAQMVVMDVEWP